jgi:hypothetical protein
MRKVKLYEFYFKAGDEMTQLCKVADDKDVVHDDVALDGLCGTLGVSGWNYVVCGQVGVYRDRKDGKFVKSVDALQFLVDRGNRKLALMVVEGVEVDGAALPRIKGYEYAVPEKVVDGSDADLDKGKDGGEVAPSATEGKLEEDVVVEEKKKLEHSYIKAEMLKMTKVELLEMCMKHIDKTRWSENMKKAELVELFFES